VAVRAVAAGDAVLTPWITRRLLDRFAGIDLERCAQADTLVRMLSAREREVLDLVARGYGNAKIARALFLSQGAVKAIISRLLTKLKCQNRVQIACLAQAAELLG
jgi:DNA-binding NarL/FixJ family response regulator